MSLTKEGNEAPQLYTLTGILEYSGLRKSELSTMYHIEYPTLLKWERYEKNIDRIKAGEKLYNIAKPQIWYINLLGKIIYSDFTPTEEDYEAACDRTLTIYETIQKSGMTKPQFGKHYGIKSRPIRAWIAYETGRPIKSVCPPKERTKFILMVAEQYRKRILKGDLKEKPGVPFMEDAYSDEFVERYPYR